MNPSRSGAAIVILGAGPAGLGAAYKLAEKQLADVTVLEQNDWVGGNAGSFKVAGLGVDYGSHRLHPSCDPDVLADIRYLLGEDLLDRPRHGRIHLKGRWIHFPLKPVDLFLKLPPDFALGSAVDMLQKVGRRSTSLISNGSFASVMEQSLGKTICQDFYFPYARKIWGKNPEELSALQAQRRVSANSPAKLARKIMASVPGLKPPGSGRFYYPKEGFGQISQAYVQAAERCGARLCLRSRVKQVECLEGGGFRVEYESDGATQTILADRVWSTLPIPVLARSLSPAAPENILAAAAQIDYRAMILIYLVLDQEHFTEFDAHYFPDINIPITRLSEPKNYSLSRDIPGKTVLCAELPCSIQDDYWQMTDSQLGQIVCQALEQVEIPVRAPVIHTEVRRLRNAYPIYLRGYEDPFGQLDGWLQRIDGLLSFGRQGLFAHDNTHHALYMAYSAVDCLDQQGNFDIQRWMEYRKVFETHVVED